MVVQSWENTRKGSAEMVLNIRKSGEAKVPTQRRNLDKALIKLAALNDCLAGLALLLPIRTSLRDES